MYKDKTGFSYLLQQGKTLTIPTEINRNKHYTETNIYSNLNNFKAKIKSKPVAGAEVC